MFDCDCVSRMLLVRMLGGVVVLLLTLQISAQSGSATTPIQLAVVHGQENLLLYARMESELEINSPSVARQKTAGFEQGKGVRKSSSAEIRFEPGRTATAARFITSEKNATSAVAVFAPDNFTFDDRADHGGKFEFWLKFNEDPHQFKGNRMILRTEPYLPALTIEIYGTRPFLALEFHGNGNNPKTNYRFITYTEGWEKWYDWKVGEWHKLTLSWKKNKGRNNAEMHLFIDDTQDGCPQKQCNDYYGILPEPESWKEVLIGNFGRNFGIDFSIMDLKSWGALYEH